MTGAMLAAMVQGAVLAAALLAFAWFFLRDIRDRAALRLAIIGSLAPIAIALMAVGSDVLAGTFLVVVGAGLLLLGHRRARALGRSP